MQRTQKQRFGYLKYVEFVVGIGNSKTRNNSEMGKMN